MQNSPPAPQSDEPRPRVATASAAPPERRRGNPLNRALLDSRERWRDLATLAADIIFETNSAGCISFISPSSALGYAEDDLPGTPGTALLAEAENAARYNPFLPSPAAMPDADITRRRVWLRDAEGKARCYAVSVRNLFDQAGAVAGTRGVAQDVTAQDQHDAAIASALRRGELLEHITRQMHEEVLAPRMIRAILEALANALGAGGAVLLSSLSGLPAEMLRHAAGNPPEPVLRRIADPAHLRATAPLILDDAENHVILLCPAATRNGEQILLGLWRDRGQRAWDSDDRALVASIAGVIGVVLAHEAVQRQMALQGASDALTGLLNRRSFLAEMTRRINRSEHDARSCVLMLINLNNFKSVNEVWGYEAGDDCLRCFGAELRAIFRPTDLIARLGGDEFAVLMDGGDHFTAGERAEQLCHEAKLHFLHWAVGRKPAPCVSAGIAYRAPCSGEGIDSLMRRADLALSRVKPGGRGGWLVSHDEAIG